MARTKNGRMTGRAGADELHDQRMALLDGSLAPTEVKVCADCGGPLGVRPVWMLESRICYGCHVEIERARQQAALWAWDQVGGKERKRGWLAGIFRLRKEIMDGELSQEWVDELHKVIEIVWGYVVHESNVARKGA